MPKVSVVMAAFNAEKYIAESIESILSQTFEDFEFIIINDGSTDSTVDIIKKFQSSDSRIILLDNNLQKGVSGAANTGIQVSRGEYIARFDSDDISLPDRLKKQVAFMDANPDVGAIGTWVQLFGNHNKLWRNPTDDTVMKATMFFHGVISNPTCMLRKSVLIEHNLLYNYVIAEDYDLFVRLSLVTKLANIPHVLVKYRTHNTNIGTVQRVEQNNSANAVRKFQCDRLGLKPSEKEWELHLNICYGEYHNTKEYLQDSFNWLTKVKQHNQDTKVFDISVFNRIIADIWVDIYRNTTPIALKTVIKLSPLDSPKAWLIAYTVLIKKMLKRIIRL